MQTIFFSYSCLISIFKAIEEIGHLVLFVFRHRSGLVTKGQFRQVMKTAGLRLSFDELRNLEDGFTDGKDFTYRPFLKPVNITQ